MEPGTALNLLTPWVRMASSTLFCARCGAEGRAPLPGDVSTYNTVVETFLAEHRDCHEEGHP